MQKPNLTNSGLLKDLAICHLRKRCLSAEFERNCWVVDTENIESYEFTRYKGKHWRNRVWWTFNNLWICQVFKGSQPEQFIFVRFRKSVQLASFQSRKSRKRQHLNLQRGFYLALSWRFTFTVHSCIRKKLENSHEFPGIATNCIFKANRSWKTGLVISQLLAISGKKYFCGKN